MSKPKQETKNGTSPADSPAGKPVKVVINDAVIQHVLALLDKHRPTLWSQPRPEITRVLNRIQELVEEEGLEALTPDRIAGQREICEQVLWTDPVYGHL